MSLSFLLLLLRNILNILKLVWYEEQNFPLGIFQWFSWVIISQWSSFTNDCYRYACMNIDHVTINSFYAVTNTDANVSKINKIKCEWF